MNRMIRRFCALTIALSTLSLWLVSTSACSGGGGANAVPDDDPDVLGMADDVDREPPGEPLAPPDDGASPPSPFELGAPTVPLDSPTGDDVGPGTDATEMAAGPTVTDDGPELQRPIGDDGDTAAIAGFWDYSRMTDVGIDVVLFAIDESGGLTEYDDQSDVVGSGLACHTVTRGSIASRGRDRYDIQDGSTLPGSRSIDDVLITADDAEITFRYLGTATDPQFDGNMIGITERYPAVTGRTADDLVICEG